MDAMQRVGGYLRGSAILGGVYGVTDFIFLVLIGLGAGLAAPLSVLVFMANFIPYIGGIIATGVILLVTYGTLGSTATVILFAPAGHPKPHREQRTATGGLRQDRGSASRGDPGGPARRRRTRRDLRAVRRHPGRRSLRRHLWRDRVRPVRGRARAASARPGPGHPDLGRPARPMEPPAADRGGAGRRAPLRVRPGAIGPRHGNDRDHPCGDVPPGCPGPATSRLGTGPVGAPRHGRRLGDRHPGRRGVDGVPHRKRARAPRHGGRRGHEHQPGRPGEDARLAGRVWLHRDA